MPRKNQYDREQIIDAAVDLIHQKGKEAYSMRNVAKHLKASTQPIYSYFADGQALYTEVLLEIKKRLLANTRIPYTEFVFRNMGYGFTLFARDYPHLFTAFFDHSELNKQFVAEFLMDLRKAVDEDERFAKVSSKGRDNLLEKMWTFSYGYASLVIKDLNSDKSDEEIKAMILDMGTTVIMDTMRKENLI